MQQKNNNDDDKDDESREKFKKKWDEIFSSIQLENENPVPPLSLISRIDIKLENGPPIYINPRQIVEKEDISFDDLERIVYNKILELQDETSSVEYHMDIQKIIEIVEEKTNEILKGI